MRYYDLIIVGAGPAGLSLAHTTSSIYRRVLIIEKEKEIGGCHRVKRNIDGMFTEHGPRIYLSTYYNFFNLLNELGLEREDVFINYKYSFFDIAISKILPYYNFYEIIMLTLAYLMFFIDDEYGKDISLYEYLRGRGFSHKVIDMFDRLCRFTDGGDVYSYSLNKILKLIDSMLLLKIYQPKSPLDIVLFSTWKKFLSNRGVDFMLGSHITDYDIQNNNVEMITLNNGEKIKCGKIVFAVPPVALLNIIKYEEGLRNAFGNYNELERWVDKTKYIDYISITYHFKEKLKLPYINGLSLDTDWGIGLINLSDFMENIEDGYSTVLSTAVSICNRNSNYTYKKANECTNDELIKEVHRQIKESIFNDLSDDYVAIVNPNNYYNVHKNKWECKDNAYFNVYNEKYMPFESSINNLYNLGTHNGKSYISYTTIESAVSNAIYLAGEIYPEVQSKYTIYKGITGKNILMVIIIIIFVLLYYLSYYFLI